MEQKDYLQRELEKLGKALAGLLGKLKETTAIPMENEIFQNEFQKVLGVTLSAMLDMSAEALEIFIAHKNLNDSSIEDLALLLYHYMQKYPDQKGHLCVEKIMQLFEISQKRSKSTSLELVLAVNSLKA